MPKATKNTRPDRRYKDPDTAPGIVSEKRMTFFLSDSSYRELRRQTGYFQIYNAEHDVAEAGDPFPETPSALVREALEFWLDHFRLRKDASRTDDEWEERLDRLADAVGKFGD